MSNNKQSSVEVFFNELCNLGFIEYPNDSLIQNRLEQAKAMRKQELEFAFKGGMSLVEGHLWKPIDKFEDWYNETFGGNK